MTHVITRACCNDATCIPACPVNCIHPAPDEPGYGTTEMLYVDPDSCVDCSACVEACPVGAIKADYDLDDDELPYQLINARWFAEPGRRDYEQEPVAHPVLAAPDAATGMRVAIVGSGPAACYAAEDLLTRRGADISVDMFERLPVPGGLVRFGVAPDHQDTKRVSETFAKTMKRKGFRLFLNTEIGRDVTMEDLRATYDAVIVAVGALSDRRLGVAGEDLAGSHSATEFVSWYNGHPDFRDRVFDLSGERAVIIGNGNVALDVARVLLSAPDDLAKSDIADHALDQLRSSNVRDVVIVGRRGAREAAYTTKELLALTQSPHFDVTASSSELERDVLTDSSYALELLHERAAAVVTSDRQVTLRFLASPLEILGDGRVSGVRLARNRLVAAPDGSMRAEATGDTEDLDCGLVLRAVGYRGSAIGGLPFDDVRGIVPNVAGRVVDGDSGERVPGMYVTGWIKRGPSGVIGTNKQCAHETVETLLGDIADGTLARKRSDMDLAQSLPDHIDLAGWRVIDQHERSAGSALRRPRVKVTDTVAMLDLARATAARS